MGEGRGKDRDPGVWRLSQFGCIPYNNLDYPFEESSCKIPLITILGVFLLTHLTILYTYYMHPIIAQDMCLLAYRSKRV